MEEPGVHEILQLAEKILAMRVTERVKNGDPIRAITSQWKIVSMAWVYGQTQIGFLRNNIMLFGAAKGWLE